MEITEQRLSDFGGWQAIKAAKEHVKLGQVADAKQDEKGFHGVVGLGKGAYRASLLVDGRGQVEGRCGCVEGRRGVICSHVLAVALQVIKGPMAPAPAPVKVAATPAAKVDSGMVKVEKPPSGRFYVSIMLSQLDRLESKGTVPVFFRHEHGEEEVSPELWNWMRGVGLGLGTQALRLGARELGELLGVLEGANHVFNGGNDIKSAQKLLIKNELIGLTEISHIKSDKTLIVSLLKRVLYKSNVANIGVVELGDQAVLVRADKDQAVEFSRFFETGRLQLPLREVITKLPEYVKMFGLLDDWLPDLRLMPVVPVFTLHLDGNLKRLLARLEMKLSNASYWYGENIDNHIYPVEDETNELVYYVRNEAAELSAWNRLKASGLKEAAVGVLEISGEAEVLRFMSTELPRLRRDFEIQEGDQWKSLSRSLAVIRPNVREVKGAESQEGSGMDWLNLEVAYESVDGVQVSRNEVLRLIRSGQRQGRTASGKRFVLDVEGCEDLEETLHDLSAKLERGGEQLAIRRRQVGVLTDFTEKGAGFGEVGSVLSGGVFAERMGNLGDRLRDYQREGVRWMERLGRAGLGGLLADEMGLGKTVQTLGLLRLLLSGSEKVGPALVVCPTSLLGNWADEARKFVPDLRIHVSHEGGRHEHWDRLKDYDVIFTSYQLVARDLEFLSKVMFEVVVLDEASYIRNAETVTSKAVRQLRSRACFALTGTPVENSVKDLWSIFEFVMPGHLPGKEAFHERYVKNMAQADSRQARAAMERLRRLVKPYLLRRTKREVVKDLPEKMEQVVWCDLTPMQREVYTRILEEGREEIRQARKKAGKGSARMTMFTVLLRLRQICNDVRLVGLKSEDGATGGKWDRFDEMLQELIEGDHRALVFSQFVGMLKLVRERLDKGGIEYCYLDGSTRDRAGQVAEFQSEGSRKRFFLISLKAGGYGLNLTAADHVLLMDPWWNPAVEAQAIDRAHRIGQGRPVTAERFVMRGTVEEKILALQAKKRAVMDMAMEEDATVMAGVSDEELEAMLMG
ncbi:hypothetical protein FEM03_15585 [Phragmitibacter flavus]|uniref:DEAD/DEAH box helicase n=1 Tax=Phragmitibacter flavus TaxID=2576071 RepID=A0A5R8KBX8_9BACT|nr:DEAD/DEAH box helicase [Phragmitibacter flavus]TLD69747.1 hypothetical protein FEM03_15585 [Phragmitibacter flavus]